MLQENKLLSENVELAELLSRHGYDRDTLGTLLLIPLIHVAWADGTVDPEEEDAIIAVAEEMGMMNPRAKLMLRRKLSIRPSPEEIEADLELISLLLASCPDKLPVTVSGIEDLAEAIGGAAGGVFGLLFTLSAEEKRALDEIRLKLEVRYDESWTLTLKALRDDWLIDDWVEFDEPNRYDDIDVDDELLFTDQGAAEIYRCGAPTADGIVMGVDDLRRTIFHDVMKRGPWGQEAAQLRLLLNEWIRDGLVTDAGRFWYKIPHARVYDVGANIRFPVMVGREVEEVSAQPMTDAAVEDLEVARDEPVVYVLLDLSGSMAGERLEKARAAIARFVDGFPVESGIKVLVRPFHSTVDAPLTPISAPLSSVVRQELGQRLSKLEAGGTTALYRAIAAALDDLLRLVHRATIPLTWLIVLSDGEDNCGLEGVSYRGKVGESALFERVRDFIDAGVVNYVPIAYGGRSALVHLSQVAGSGTDVQVAYPASISDRLKEVRRAVLADLPLGQ